MLSLTHALTSAVVHLNPIGIKTWMNTYISRFYLVVITWICHELSVGLTNPCQWKVGRALRPKCHFDKVFANCCTHWKLSKWQLTSLAWVWHELASMCSLSVSAPYPADTLRNNDVVITSNQRHFDVITSKWRFDVITTLLLCHMSATLPWECTK